MKKGLLLLSVACLLAGCERPSQSAGDMESAPDATVMPQPADEGGAVASDAIDEVPVVTEAETTAGPLVLDLTVPPLAHDEVEPLPHDPKADIGNVFEKNDKPKPVNVSGEVMLREEFDKNGKPKTVVDGAQVTVEKPIR